MPRAPSPLAGSRRAKLALRGWGGVATSAVPAAPHPGFRGAPSGYSATPLARTAEFIEPDQADATSPVLFAKIFRFSHPPAFPTPSLGAKDFINGSGALRCEGVKACLKSFWLFEN